MTLSIKNGGYAFLIRLDLMLSMSLWKEFQLLQTLINVKQLNSFKLCAVKKSLKMICIFYQKNYMWGIIP